jgi:2'-5' RNA ligase
MGMINTYLAYVPLPDELRDRLDAYTKELKNNELDMLSVPRLRAHVTLMRMNCEAPDEQHLDDGLSELEHELVSFKPEEVKKFSQSAVALKMEESEAIHDLHLAVADVFANKQAQPTQHVKPKHQDRYDTIQKYGSPFFGEYYNPHMTIGYTGEDFDDLPLPRDVNESIQFEATEVVLSKKEQDSGRPYEEVGRYEFA